MRRLWVIGFSVVIGIGAVAAWTVPALADDQSDYASLMSKIDGSRLEVMTSCFKGGDARHRRALQDAQEVRELCMQKVKDLCP